MGRNLRRRPSSPFILALALATALTASCGGSEASDEDSSGAADKAKQGDLPEATTHATLQGLPDDPDPLGKTDGTVVRVKSAQKIYDRPEGTAVGILPSTQLDGPTWVPVVESKDGWQRVLLPSRPNGSTGWISSEEGEQEEAKTPYVVRVKLSARKMDILKSGKRLGPWTVAVGAPKTPTPTGRTFMHAVLSPSDKSQTPLVLPVGAHSDTLDTFGGGPGTVAFHGWNDDSVFGKAISHGCIRVPSEALRQLSAIPLGSLVIVNK